MATIATYQYTYGAGAGPNRSLEFQENNGKINAIVRACSKGEWKKISEIDEDHMSVEMASTSEKLRIMMEARKSNSIPTYPQDKTLSQLTPEDKLKILKNLDPYGNWRISIQNGIGNDLRFEAVVHLNFHRPE